MTTDIESLISGLESNMSQVVLGKPDVVRKCLVALFAGEHVLLEDVPGVGKTLVAKALAKSVAGKFCRIQFTPDLLPSDIVGSNIFNSNLGQFRFSPRTNLRQRRVGRRDQSDSASNAKHVLEAMSDRQASIDGTSHAPSGSVHRDRHSESLRIRRYLSTAGKSIRSIPDSNLDGLPRS